MSNDAGQGQSLLARAQSWFRELPLITKSVLGVCVSSTLACAISNGYWQHWLCLEGFLAIWKLQIYRIFTSIWVHSGAIHLLLNMLAFVPISKNLENQLGSIVMMYLILVISALANIFFMASSALLERFVSPRLGGCALGLSGVIFGLVVIETKLSGVQQRSIFGLFTIPAQYYPWALLVLCQLILPHVSFLGHLGGILAGQLLVLGWLNRVVPSSSRFQALENERPFRSISLMNSFVQNRSTGPIFLPEADLGSPPRPQTSPSVLNIWWNKLISIVSRGRSREESVRHSNPEDNAPDQNSSEAKVRAGLAAEARFASFKAGGPSTNTAQN